MTRARALSKMPRIPSEATCAQRLTRNTHPNAMPKPSEEPALMSDGERSLDRGLAPVQNEKGLGYFARKNQKPQVGQQQGALDQMDGPAEGEGQPQMASKVNKARNDQMNGPAEGEGQPQGQQEVNPQGGEQGRVSSLDKSNLHQRGLRYQRLQRIQSWTFPMEEPFWMGGVKREQQRFEEQPAMPGCLLMLNLISKANQANQANPLREIATASTRANSMMSMETEKPTSLASVASNTLRFTKTNSLQPPAARRFLLSPSMSTRLPTPTCDGF